MFGIKKKKYDYIVEIYENDLCFELSKVLSVEKSENIKEFFFVEHSDAVEKHFHIYLSLYHALNEQDIKKIFYNSKCFITPLEDGQSVLQILYSFTSGFRLPFITSYTVKQSTKKPYKKPEIRVLQYNTNGG